MTDKRYTYADWVKAFQIFAQYSDDRIEINAGHAVIYTGPHPDVVTAQDVERLEALGWFINEEHECFEYYT